MLHLMGSDHWPGFKVKHMDLVWLVLAYKTLSLVHFQLPDILILFALLLTEITGYFPISCKLFMLASSTMILKPIKLAELVQRSHITLPRLLACEPGSNIRKTYPVCSRGLAIWFNSVCLQQPLVFFWLYMAQPDSKPHNTTRPMYTATTEWNTCISDSTKSRIPSMWIREQAKKEEFAFSDLLKIICVL